MADYWKSNAKKFCQICKTWYADNKISIENHERGTKHKAMVQQRLREGAQKAQRKEREQAELQSTLRQMEQAALVSMLGEGREKPPPEADTVGPKPPPTKLERERQAFKEQQRKLAELKRTAAHSQFWDGGDVKTEGGSQAEDGGPAHSSLTPAVLDRQWVEALHETGHAYYWHITTGETRWEQPLEGFYTTAEYSAKYAEMMTTIAGSSVAASVESDDAVPAFTSMPQSSLAGADPFAVDNRTDRRRKAGEKRRAPDDEEDYDDDGSRERKPTVAERPSRVPPKPVSTERRSPVRMSLLETQDCSRSDRLNATTKPKKPVVKEEAQEFVEKPAEKQPPRPIAIGLTEAADNQRLAHPLGPWVPVIKEEKPVRVVADLPEQIVKRKAADIIAEMEMDPNELRFAEKVLDSSGGLKKSSKVVQFKKRSIANKANMRQRID